MKKLLILLIFPLFTTAMGLCQSRLSQQEVLRSDILGRDVNYSVYLPEGYDRNNRSYPVLYLLHGMGDDHRGWSQQGEVQAIADRCIAEGMATQMIIVMPDARQSWYVNRHDGSDSYEDMFFRELIPHIDAGYRTLPDKEYRAIAGLSMGGHGALLYSLRHPELFSGCCALSAAVYSGDDIERRGGDFAELFRRIFGPDFPNEYWGQNNPMDLAQTIPDGQKRAVRLWIDCGDDDFLYRGNSMLHILLRDRGIPHEYRVRDGGHSWTYWRTALPEVLRFVSESFRRS